MSLLFTLRLVYYTRLFHVLQTPRWPSRKRARSACGRSLVWIPVGSSQRRRNWQLLYGLEQVLVVPVSVLSVWQIGVLVIHKIRLESGPVTADLTTTFVHSNTLLKNDVNLVNSLLFCIHCVAYNIKLLTSKLFPLLIFASVLVCVVCIAYIRKHTCRFNISYVENVTFMDGCGLFYIVLCVRYNLIIHCMDVFIIDILC